MELPQDFYTHERFNSAIDYLRRISELFRVCNALRCAGNLPLWKLYLDAVHAELSPKITKKAKKHDKAELQQLSNQVNKIAFKYYEEKSNLGKRGDITELNEVSSEFYTILNTYEFKLRYVMEDLGLLTPKGDDPRFAALN